jgi:hypothetical protein
MSLKSLTGLALAALAVTACSDDADPVAPAPAAATVYVLHGINGTDLGAAQAFPVDVAVNGSCTLQAFSFKDFAGPLALPPGTYAIAISPANTTTPCSNPAAISADVPVTSGINATIVAHLAEGGAPTASVFVNDFAPASPQLFARHAADFSAVDVVVNPGASQVAFTGLTNSNEDGGGLGATGTYRVTIAPANTNTYVYDQTLQLAAGTLYAAYAVGTPSNNTFEVVLQTIPQ